MNNFTNTEIEKVVLGAIIDNPNLFYANLPKLSHSLFSATEHKQIFDIITNLQKKGKPLDLLLIQAEIFSKKLNLNSHLKEISENNIITNNFEHYLGTLIELSVKRQFIKKFSKLINTAQTSNEDIYKIRDTAIEEFNSIFIKNFAEIETKDELFPVLIDKVENRFSKIKDTIPGIESSLNIINKAFGGWQNSDLTIVAGRPGMGKSAFMVQQILDVSCQNRSVGVFSLEMSAEQITSRIITNYTEIPNSSILRKGLSADEWDIYKSNKKHLQELKIHIDGTPNLSIESLRMKAKMMKIRYKIDILMIDYLQLITFEKSQNREQEVAKISRNLKAIAKELDIPIIALAQLSRYVEQRGDKRPFLSDLRDSGSIEQDADEVIFLYRPEYYGIDQWREEYNHESTHNQIEIIIAKNRQGGTLSERYNVNLATSTFKHLLDKI